jgi:hypothetical protein
MWWEQPPLLGFRPRFAHNLLEVIARAFAVVQVGGLHGTGPERGRNFEHLFYALCDRRGLLLTEKAGGRSVGGQRSGSGLSHEVDAASRGAQFATHWELKHLTGSPDKNDFLIFNGKGLDFLQGHDESATTIPLLRFFLTGSNVSDACRRYAAFWGISIIEPDRLPLALLYESVVRGGASSLSGTDCVAIKDVLPRGFRSLQDSIADLADRTAVQPKEKKNRVVGPHWPAEIVDIQEQIGAGIFDFLDEVQMDWLDELAEITWTEVGGW